MFPPKGSRFPGIRSTTGRTTLRKFTYKELTTTLATLRHLQNDIEENGTEGLIATYPHFDDVDPLTVGEIDGLCEAMYSGHAGIVENDRLINMMDDASRFRQLAKMIARLDTTEDFEQRGSVMENDDAVDTVDRLISEARDLVPREVWEKSHV
jgi:ribosomal protein L29